MSAMADNEWSRNIERVLTAHPDLETWTGHFQQRISELEDVAEFWPKGHVRNSLEIGCGNGLAAVFFSPRADRIVASDLASVDSQAHSIGLDFARKFLGHMKITNVEVLGCSAEAIPLPDQSFDLVYGIYCLEHIPDRPKALGEVRRVLRVGGETLLTVPGTSWCLLNPFYFYSYLLNRIVVRLGQKFFRSRTRATSATDSLVESSRKIVGASSFLRYYPNFPLPEPHGTHSSWFAELKYCRASNWKKVLEAAGFENVSVEPITFVPAFLRDLLPVSWTKRIEGYCKKRRAMAPLAQFFCLRGTAPARSEGNG